MQVVSLPEHNISKFAFIQSAWENPLKFLSGEDFFNFSNQLSIPHVKTNKQNGMTLDDFQNL